MNHLVYLSYGLGPHVDETRFAILSAIHLGGVSPAGYQTLVVTDDPTLYQDLPVATETLSADQMRDWVLPDNYRHRIKIKTMQHLLQTRGGRVVLVDSDTYFVKSPQKLFDRVGPGRTVMHVPEGKIGYLAALGFNRRRLTEMSFDLGPAGAYDFDAETIMWNSGVLGIDAADMSRVDEALELNDALFAAEKINFAEQLAFTRVLHRHTKLSASRDVLFHYHQSFLRNPFREKLPTLLEKTGALPPLERAAIVYESRPRPTTEKVIKAAFKRRLKPFGFFKNDLETSI